MTKRNADPTLECRCEPLAIPDLGAIDARCPSAPMHPTELIIRVPGEPVAWAHAQRPIHDKNGKGAMATYIPGRVRQWQDQVASFAQKAAAASGWTKLDAKTPICVDIDFHFHRPSGYRKAELWKRTKPDRDKLDRAVLDSLTWAGVIHDDALVCDGRIRKLIDDDWQGAVITIAEAE